MGGQEREAQKKLIPVPVPFRPANGTHHRTQRRYSANEREHGKAHNEKETGSHIVEYRAHDFSFLTTRRQETAIHELFNKDYHTAENGRNLCSFGGGRQK